MILDSASPIHTLRPVSGELSHQEGDKEKIGGQQTKVFLCKSKGIVRDAFKKRNGKENENVHLGPDPPPPEPIMTN